MNLIDKKDILVYGVGSLGAYLSAKLSRMGHKVDIIGHEKAKNIGSTLLINDKKYKFPKVYSSLDNKNLKKKYNYVFFTSKYFDLKKNLEKFNKSGIDADTIILIQNSYFDRLWYYNLIKDKMVVTVSVFEGFNLRGNKMKHILGTGWHIEDDILGKDTYNLLKESGINIHLTDKIDVRRAEKTLHNCSLNVFSALEKKTFNELLKDRKTVSRMKKIFEESYDVLNEIVPLKSKRALWQECTYFMKKMNHYSSTAQDVFNNKKTEVSFLNGFIVEMGKKMDIKTPYNEQVIEEFKKKYPKLY